MFPKLWIYFLVTTCLWCVSKVKCYDDFCDEPQETIYCTCDIKYMHTIMACYINADMNPDHKVWSDMSKVENVVTLTLFSRFPAQLEEIPVKNLKLMPYLEIVKVQQANLTVLRPYAVSDLKVLRELNLDGCEITGMERHSIANLPKLKELSLSDNLLEEILAESFSGLLDLERLFLDQNKISRIEPCAFCDLQNLRELELWSNQITDLSDYMFRGLRYLKRLDISKNKIGILNDKIFHGMPKLEELDLSYNLIHHVASRTFQGVEKLYTLNLQHNAIKILPDNAFKSLTKLRKIILRNNDLETFQVKLLENIVKIKDPNFYLDLKENPLMCDCRLSWVKKYIEMDLDRFFKKELQQLECHTKDGNITLVHLLDMDLDMDCSKSIDDDKTEVTTSLKTLDGDEKLEMTTSQTLVFDLIPSKIQKVKNKTRVIKEENSDDVYVNQDSEVELEDSEVIDSETSSSRKSKADSHVVVFVTLVTVFLVRKRKGTCLC